MTKVLPELYEENNEIPNIFQDILHTNDNKQRNNLDYREVKEEKQKSNALVNNFNL